MARNQPDRGSTVEFCASGPDGDHAWIHHNTGSPAWFRSCMLCQFIDVSELAQAANALREQTAAMEHAQAQIRSLQRAADQSAAQIVLATNGLADVLGLDLDQRRDIGLLAMVDQVRLALPAASRN